MSFRKAPPAIEIPSIEGAPNSDRTSEPGEPQLDFQEASRSPPEVRRNSLPRRPTDPSLPKSTETARGSPLTVALLEDPSESKTVTVHMPSDEGVTKAKGPRLRGAHYAPLGEDGGAATLQEEKEGWKPVTRQISKKITAHVTSNGSIQIGLETVPSDASSQIPTTTAPSGEVWTGATRMESTAKAQLSLPHYSWKEPQRDKSTWGQFTNTIFAIGVIYGDLGTSTIYTLPSVFTGPPTAEETVGALSLLLWALFMTVSIKYVVFLMSCDYHGEGGSFALYSLIRSTEGLPKNLIKVYTLIAFIGASMLIGDGIITPAVSVLSAVEGLAVYSDKLHPAILPVSVVILVILFLVQRFGTQKIGKFFGPVMVLWFFSAGALGIYNIYVGDHTILRALSPHYGLKLLFLGNGFDLLGGIVLAVTGCEAMYADMGHFGKSPIRWSWNLLCFPMLVLCYLGQGALLLKSPEKFVEYPSPFYAMVPPNFLWPVILIACAATIIASQSLIVGASSIVHQAVKLGFFPRVRTYHTSTVVEGQIYIPAVNYTLMVAVVAVCLGFKESVKLGNAFGMAVTFDMVFTSFFFVGVLYYRRHTNIILILAYCVVYWIIDFAFLASNMKKFVHGGWLPILIAGTLATIMIVWHHGSLRLKEAAEKQAPSMEDINRALKDNVAHRVPGTAFFFSPSENISPGIWQLITGLHTLPSKAILLNVRFVLVPFVSPTSPLGATALHVEPLNDGLYKVTATFGYAQSKVYAKTIALDVIKELDRLAYGDPPSEPYSPSDLIPPTPLPKEFKEEKILYIICREHIQTKKEAPLHYKLFIWAFNFLARYAPDIANTYHIPTDSLVEMGVRFVV